MTQRVAFYGAGEQARPYLEVLGRRPEVQVAAVCDLDRRAAEQVAAGWGADVFLSYEPMLQEIRPDALWVCVPPQLQGEVILRAAELRIPFFVEPPGALEYPRAVQYAKAVQEAKLVTAVGFPAAWTDVVREGREYVGTNVPPLALGRWLRPARQGSPSASMLLWNEACVLLDLLRGFCGAVSQVHAFAAGNPESPEDAGGLVLHLTFARGTIAVVTLATFPRPEPRIELELIGDTWTLHFENGLASLRVVEHDKTTILRGLNNPAEEACAAFLTAVEANDPGGVAVTYLDALETLHVCHAAREALRQSQPVSLP